MPFEIELNHIEDSEKDLNVRFPEKFKSRMEKSNGGELDTDEFEIELYPFFDNSDKKRISRTCNHIGLETRNAREWTGFPENGIAIGSDGFGNQIILLHDGDGKVNETIYFWDHETGEVEIVAESINDIEE